MVTRYEQVAIEISGLISRGILRPGDRIPSVRKACQQYRANAGTILQAYGELETRGLIFARPQSGYYVRAQEMRRAPEPSISSPRNGSTRVDVEVLATIKDREIVPLIGFSKSGAVSSRQAEQDCGRSGASHADLEQHQ